MPKFHRRSEWIWRPRGLVTAAFETTSPCLADETNRYVYFRRTIEIPAPIRAAHVYASADGRYQLFVNGSFAGRGPARCSSSFQSVDIYDLTPLLRPGRNVIAALAHSYGRNTAWYELPGWDHGRTFGCGGFFLQGDVITATGVAIPLDTAATWRCKVSEAWQRDVLSNSLGFMEIYDARRAPENWMNMDFDDTTWEKAEVLRVPGRNFAGDVVPFATLTLRAIPPMREFLSASPRVVGIYEVITASEPDLAEQIAKELFRPPEHCLVLSDAKEIQTEDGYGIALVYDFGEIVAGYIHLEFDGPDGAMADVVYGEQLSSDGRVKIFGGIAGFDAVPAHRYTLREGRQTWERFEWNGLRYLQITFRNCHRPIRVMNVAIRTTEYPVEEIGEFECSDDLLNRVWQAGARTLRRCMHDGYIDCPSREQRQWMDAYVAARINYVTYGDAKLAGQLLRQMAQSQRADGLTMMAAPGDFSLAGFTNIPDFCLYWIMMIADYVLYTGDTAIVGELFPSVMKAIRWFERQLNDEDLLTNVPHWVFMDWAELDKHGQVTALNAQFVAALRAAANFAQIGEFPGEAARYRTLADRVASAINILLWDGSRGIYSDARMYDRLSRRMSQQANAAAIAYGVAPRDRWSAIFNTILDEERLTLTRVSSREDKSVPFNEDRDVVLAQPFFMHFVHRAMRQAGLYKPIVENIRRRWAAMLLTGDTTFWETWRIDVITSKCHAWSATPTFDLSTDVLGISPLEPGFRCIRVAPQLADLEWARGQYPTPQGPIGVEWTYSAERFELTVRLPSGCKAEIVCPLQAGWKIADSVVVLGATLMASEGTHRFIG